MMKKCVDDFIVMNTSGQVLELCEKYYDDNVMMLSNGEIFATSMIEAYEKQKGFVETVKAFDVTLLSCSSAGDNVELCFQYSMIAADSSVSTFIGRHTQTWRSGKIMREEYVVE